MDGSLLRPSGLPDRFRLVEDLSPSLGPSTFLVEDRLFPARRCVLALSAPDASEEAARAEVERIRSLLRIRHPRLTPIVAARLDAEGGPPFFVVERPDGVELLERIRVARERGGVAEGFAALRRKTLRLCDALEHLHGRGIIHYDLRPARILVDAHDEPIVLGYGLAAPQLDDLDRSPTSLGYTAPEILRGDPVDHRADLYSLGVVLYEAIVGRNPFLGADATETARAHLEVFPPPPSAAEPAVPRDLDEVITLLLAKNPSRSFATAAEVAAALDPHARPARRRPPPLSPYAFTQNEYVGRRREQRILEARFRRVRDGLGPVGPVALVGAAGMGKSRLLAELRQRVRLGGGAFLETRFEAETGGARGALAGIVRRAAELSPEDAELARRAASALVPRIAPEEAGERAARCIEAAARRVPLVAAFDDLHLADASGARALEALLVALARPELGPGAPRVLVCLATRESPPIPSPGLRRWLVAAPQGGASAALRLGELSRREIGRFVASIFGSGPSARAVASLVERTVGGNPYLLEETIRSWIARGLVRWREGVWEVDAERIRATSSDLRTLMVERLRDLPPGSERWLRLAALLGRPLTRSWIDALGSHAGADPDVAARDLLRRGLLRRFVRSGEERFEVAHALLADAVADATPPQAKRELHRAIADACEASRERRTRDPVEVALHRIRAGDPAAAARLLAEAPELQDPDGASAARLPLLEELAQSLSPGAGERATALRWLGEARLAAGDLRGAAFALEEATERARRRRDHVQLAAAAEALAAVRRAQGDERGALRALAGAFQAASASRDELRRGAVLEQVGRIHLERGDLSRARSFLARSARHLERAGAPQRPRALVGLAQTARERGDLAEAERWLRAAHDA
ncbi:MAG TPA: AAA family ATPase, partial [Planctomycetota bacterium]|nr:AAA family ATPase [Planctomycetota bacterium]